MALFKDAQEVYDTIGKLFVELADDEELAPKFRKANTIVRYEYSEPESAITVRLQEGEPGRGRLRRVRDGARGDDDDGRRHRAPLLARPGERHRRPRPRPDQGQGPGREDPQAGAAGEARLPALQGAARGAGPPGPGWSHRHEGRGVGGDRRGPRRQARRRPTSRSAALNPQGGPPTLCPGGTNRITGELATEFWGASCDADEREEGGLFSKTVLPGAVLAKAHMPDLAKVVPIFNVESVEPGERVEQLASRRKVEFESIDFNKRYLATVPADHDPIALRELFSPGFLDWAAQIRNEVDFGITDRQLYFHWRLGELTEARVRRRARPRRRAVQAAAQRDGGARPAHLPARALARGPGAVPATLTLAGTLDPLPLGGVLRSGPWPSCRSASGARRTSGCGRAALRQLEAADQLVRDERPLVRRAARPGRRGPGSSPAR